MSDHSARCRQDVSRRAVIVRQHDNFRVVIVLAEALDIANVRALKTENRLIVVADRHDVGIVIIASQVEQQPQLRQVGILKFVDHDELKLLLEVGAQFRVGLAGLNNGQNHVVVIKQRALGQHVAICFVDVNGGG